MADEMTTEMATSSEKIWWKNGYVWMVLGGPLAVVVASVITFIIAARDSDPVLGVSERMLATSRAAAAPAPALVPAMQGRNHATTGGVPEKNSR